MDKDSQKNKRNTTMLGQKRHGNPLFSNFQFRPMFQSDINTLYETTSWQYKHLFSFNWDDKCIKDKEYPCKYSFYSFYLVDNMSPAAFWFLVNCSYFPSDLQEIKQHSDCLREVFASFSGEVDNLPLKKNSSLKQRMLLEHDLLSLNSYYQNEEENNNKSTNDSSEISHLPLSLNDLETKLCETLKKVGEINERKTNQLRERLDKEPRKSISRKMKEEDETSSDDDEEDAYVNGEMNENDKLNMHLLKDMMIYNKERSAYFSYLKTGNMKKINEHKKKGRIFTSEEEINKIKEEDDWLCCICNNGDLDENQLIYECESCSVTVHQSCYGIQTQSVQHWRCDPCLLMSRNKTQQLQCILCKVKGGAMKQVNLPKDSTFVKNIMRFRTDSSSNPFPKYTSTFIIPKTDYASINKSWAHLSCCLWNPDVKFPHLETKTDISQIDCIDYKRWGDRCDLCNKSNYGPTLKCNEEACPLKYHPECARINHYYLEIENINKFLNYNVYCLDHQPIKIKKNIMKRYDMKAKDILEFNQLLSKYYKAFEKDYKKSLLTIQPQRRLLYKGSDVNPFVTNTNYSKEHLLRNQVNNYDTYPNGNDQLQLTWRNVNSLNGNQKQFITKLTCLCRNYTSINRIILSKKRTVTHQNEEHLISIEEEDNEEQYTYQVEAMKKNRNLLDYEDLFRDDFPWSSLHFKNYGSDQLRKYFMKLVPDNEAYNYLFKSKEKEEEEEEEEEEVKTRTVEIVEENGKQIIRDYNGDIKLYCYCKEKWDETQMIGCNYYLQCKGSPEGWYHRKCIKETEKMSLEEIHSYEFICNECKKVYE